MTYVYSHLPQEEDIGPEGRSYTVEEGILEYRGRKVLYLRVEAHNATFCDGSYIPHLGSINVKGYVARWKCGRGEDGEEVSDIEPISDQRERQGIKDMLKSTHNTSRVDFI
ncbi:hypothetical protein ACFLX5_05580 [Chloroflexota bacterium]